MKLLVRQSSLVPWYLVSLSPKYLAQDSILILPMPVIFPQCDRPSFTPIQNNRQIYISVCFNLVFSGSVGYLALGRESDFVGWIWENLKVSVSVWRCAGTEFTFINCGILRATPYRPVLSLWCRVDWLAITGMSRKGTHKDGGKGSRLCPKRQQCTGQTTRRHYHDLHYSPHGYISRLRTLEALFRIAFLRAEDRIRDLRNTERQSSLPVGLPLKWRRSVLKWTVYVQYLFGKCVGTTW